MKIYWLPWTYKIHGSWFICIDYIRNFLFSHINDFSVFIILISTLCACKTNILNSHPVLHYLFFVFPPIENFTSICQISNWGEFIIIAKETLIFLIYDDGFNDGVECGIERGIIQGVEQGTQMANTEAIKNMIKLNVPKDKILECYSEAEYNAAIKDDRN